MFKKFTIALVVCAMTVLMVPALPAAAADSGNVTGQFGINGKPTVSVSLTTTTTPGVLTPQTDCTVTVTVSDPDKLSDITGLVLMLWYDSTGVTPTELSSADADAQNCAVITWTPGDGAALTPAETTWSLGANPTIPSFGDSSGDFIFEITIGKVATETSGSAKWQIAAVATDTANQAGFGHYAGGASMSWYGEITVPTDVTVDWGTLAPGIQFNGAGSKAALGETITYISNGAYDKKVKSGATWSGAGESTANLSNDGTTTAAQSFALQAATTDTYSTAEIVKTTDVTIDSTGTQTTEDGIDVTAMTFWIQLASSFTVDKYTGTITYSISN